MINAIAHYILNGTKLFVHQFISAVKEMISQSTGH